MRSSTLPINNVGILSFYEGLERPRNPPSNPHDHMLAYGNVNQSCVLGHATVLSAMLRNRGVFIAHPPVDQRLLRATATPSRTPLSKFAVRGMTKTAALEHDKANIAPNSIHPGG